VLEEHDAMCAVCHAPPEATFVARSATQPPVDLASAHASADPAVRCIDCHAGPSLRDRHRGLALAATDAWSWVRGDYVVVGSEYAPLGPPTRTWPDEACAACHESVLEGEAFEHHYHHLLDDPEAPEVACTLCHAAHITRPGHPAFLTDEDAAPGCIACHDVMGGPSSPVSTGGAPTARWWRRAVSTTR
jgi:predicted CXXCH cytochrome family protein